MASSNRFGHFIFAIKIVLLVAIVYWLFRTFPHEQWDGLVHQEKNWWMLGNAFVVVLIAHLISFWRWLLLVQALGVPFRWVDAIRLGFLGTLLNFVSVGSVGGDVFKAIEAARNAEAKKAEIVASVLVDRAVGLLGLVLVASISLSFAESLSPRMRWIWIGAMILSMTGMAGLFTIVWVGHRFPINWMTKIPLIGHVLHRLVHSCMIFQGKPRLVCELILSGIAVHSCLTLGVAMTSFALYADAPSIARHFMTIPPAMAAATLPLTPGGVGVQEAAIQTLFQEWPDIPTSYSGFIVAGVYRILLIGVALIGAIYYVLGKGKMPEPQ